MKVVLKHAGRWLHFQNPEKVLKAEAVEEVLPMLAEAEASGLFAAGFVSYEAAPAFDDALTTHDANGFPLLCLGLFHAPDVLESIEEAPTSSFALGTLEPSVSRDEFTAAIGRIKERIAEGATYQVNYTYRLHAPFSGDPWALFYELAADRRTGYSAYVEIDQFVVCSASPELFFSFNKGRIIARPMKGTARRGRTFVEDGLQAEALRASKKDRAENIMIVDMIRNDIGRVAEPGTVETISTYDIEKYPTLWQMTSTVQGQLRNLTQSHKTTKVQGGSLRGFVASCDDYQRSAGSVVEIFQALFPCASITGAPKAKTMEIIRELEASPRKVYTGSIGFISPHGEACFNVAIRTALIDKSTGTLEYGVGGGIVWDSEADAEYEETLTKTRILTEPGPDFKLLETMKWEPEGGIFLLEEHLQRLGKSAAYFDVPVDVHGILQDLEGIGRTCADVPHRIRLLLSMDGTFEVQAFPIDEGRPSSPSASRVPAFCVAIATEPVDSQDIFLFHKTTRREVYEKAKAGFPEADDVILWNEKGEVTESTIANIVIEKGGRLITPPVECGLLAGTFRGHLLKTGEVEEGIVAPKDLREADGVFLVNSVRMWQRARLI